ncbi:MAG: LuxR C-terminal-related transcriptional regulator [Nocardiaceae bacterium]|nr:LuxR C-terminal-related transcriptional regulator [Nocardiaceae bacterium]
MSTISPSSMISVAEVLSALALATDVATGVHFEKSLQTCLVADALARDLGLDERDRRATYHAALLRGIGCTSNASESAELFVDDVAFQSAFHVLDVGRPDVLSYQLSRFGEWVPGRQSELAQRFVDLAPTVGPVATRAGCEVSRVLGAGLTLDDGAIHALDQVYERWDGLGLPNGLSGEQIALPTRIVHIAEQAVLAAATGGRELAVAEVRARAGGQLDPALAARFEASVLDVVEHPDLVAAVVAAEPGERSKVAFGNVDRLCLTFAMVADLKGRYLLGHSMHVAQLATDAARLLGMSDLSAVRATALVQDIGRVAVSAEIWDRPGPLGVADWERVRLHSYWSGRILQRCPATKQFARDAASHHERCDGSGYPHGASRAEVSATARLLAAADLTAALTEDRPHRPALKIDDAAATVHAEVKAGRIDREAAGAVLEAAGMPKPRNAYPCDLTSREVDVLRLAVRGKTNREIAAVLCISDRTVGHHLAHVYDKTGVRTRPGIAVFAMQHGLLVD